MMQRERVAPSRALRATCAIALGLTLAAMAACKPKPAPIASRKLVLPDSAEQLIFGFDAMVTDNGVNKGRLLADTAYLYRNPSGFRYELRHVNMTFFTPQGVVDGTMTGREGTYIDAQKRVEGRGNVIIIRKDGNRLESPQLIYDNGRDRIFSDSSFVLTQPNKRVLSGVGFESDPKLTNLKCMRNCKGAGSVRVPQE